MSLISGDFVGSWIQLQSLLPYLLFWYDENVRKIIDACWDMLKKHLFRDFTTTPGLVIDYSM
jgi:hypothetical protein